MDFGRIEGKEAGNAKLMIDKGYDFSSLTGLPQTRSSLRKVSSSVLHYGAAKITKNHKLTKKYNLEVDKFE